ncbi:MAG: hypothetical protein M3P30_11075 [Chloroflexota bacterium]|nr:hypothetical protein [Chloroflexota bacterium]
MKRSLFILPALAVALAALTVAVAPLSPARAAATQVTYAASGAYAPTYSCVGEPCVLTVTGYQFTGDLSCASCTPSAGSFSTGLTITKFYPPNPCRAKVIDGTLSVVWNDSSTSTATLSGHWQDSKAIVLTGTWTGGTRLYPPAPIKLLLHPPSPCNPGAFDGTLVFSPT